MKRVVPVALALGLFVISAAPTALAGGPLKVKPVTFAQGTTCKPQAAWVTKQGLPDAGGSGHALFLSKPCASSENAAAFGLIDGTAGMTMNDLQALGWQHRNDGQCSGGAGRWNIVGQRSDGSLYVAFLGCGGAEDTQTTTVAGWTQDSWDRSDIVAAVTTAGGDPVNDKLVQLAIAFDEGPAFVYLDDITVNTTVMGQPGS